MNEHRYETKGKMGPMKRSRWSWDEIVSQIAKYGMWRLKDIRYANPERLRGKRTQQLNRNELLKLWKAVEEYRSAKIS